MATPTESQPSLSSLQPTIHNADIEIDLVDYSSRAQWLRAVIVGANDGLVSITSLMIGVGAVQKDVKIMIPIAGIVAGACGMAIGEFVSVYSQHDIEMAHIERDSIRGSRDEVEERKRKVPSPFEAAGASLAGFTVAALVPLLAGAFIRDYGVRVAVVVAAVSFALLGLGGVSAVVGRAPVIKPSVRVLVGGWLAMGVTFSLTKLLEPLINRVKKLN